eukprot:gene28355-37288_t
MARRRIPGPAGADFQLQRTEGQHTLFENEISMPSTNLNSLLSSLALSNKASSIGSVHDGVTDLRIPHLVALIEDYRVYCDGSWILELVDSSGYISGFVSARNVKQVGGLFCRGASVSIFVNKCPFYRTLNIHPRCVRAIVPPESPREIS